MAANDRPADVQWLIDNQTDEVSGYMARGKEMPLPSMTARRCRRAARLIAP